MKTIIQNGLVVNSAFTAFEPVDVVIRDGIIEKLVPHGTPAPADATVVDAKGQYVLPGMLDMHVHGCNSVHFGDPVDFTAGLEFCTRNGITTIIPTLGSRPMDVLHSSIAHILTQMDKQTGARIGGIHLEGPFISEKKKGAMTPPDVECSVEVLHELIDATKGNLRIMTIAPERENAPAVIAEGRRLGIRMSLGHTDANYSEAMAGIEAGATGATHTFNAMRSLTHREPGVLGAVLTDPRVTCEAICDLIHLEPATIKLILAAKGADKMILVSDSSMFVGMPNGEYMLNGKLRIVKDGVARLQDGTLSASCFCAADGARRLAEMGVPLLDIAKVTSRNPARETGLTDRGSIAAGMLADLIVTDENMHISTVIMRGQEV